MSFPSSRLTLGGMPQQQPLQQVSASTINARQSIAPSNFASKPPFAAQLKPVQQQQQHFLPQQTPSAKMIMQQQQAPNTAMIPRMSLSRGRMSSIGDPRQSLGGKNLSKKQDPRPLHNKQYVAQMAKNVFNYLDSHGFEHNLDLARVQNPMSNDFKLIADFLCRKVDPSFSCIVVAPQQPIVAPNSKPTTAKNNVKAGQATFDADAFLFVLAMLKYPFPLNKKTIAGATITPLTWPTILASLDWLVNLLLVRLSTLFNV